MLARAPGFEEACSSSTSIRPPSSARRLRDVRRRALARERGGAARGDEDRGRAAGTRQPRAARAAPCPVRRGHRADAARARPRSARLREKNGFKEVVVGVSGGIDSALTAALAVEALGPTAFTASRCLPATPPGRRGPTRAGSPRTSAASSGSCRSSRWSRRIRRAGGVLRRAASRSRRGEPPGTDPRRAAMALSNKFGWLLVASGNKSELSVGYATLYGDMAGGFALLKDVYKTDVFRLARHLNERAGRELDPESTIERAAERRAARGPARPGLAPALPRPRPRSSRPTSRTTARARS